LPHLYVHIAGIGNRLGNLVSGGDARSRVGIGMVIETLLTDEDLRIGFCGRQDGYGGRDISGGFDLYA
jgi:hypothetical protein